LNEAKIAQRLREDSAYKDFFKATMKKFGVESPKELTGAKKKEFFNYVDKNYKAKSEALNELDYFTAHSSDSNDTKKAIAQLQNTFQALQDQYKVPARVLEAAVEMINQLVDQGFEDGRAEATNNTRY
jgi:hypothetical protein